MRDCPIAGDRLPLVVLSHGYGGSFLGHGPGYRYLRAKGNSIEGGTSEIMRNVVAERVLGLPPDHRPDKGVAFKDVPR